MRIAQDLLDEIVAHARAEYDAECCGLIAYASAPGGPVAVRVHRATNTFASRKRFEIDGRELLQTINEFENEDWELGAIYHSHTHTAPYPSQTDINFAANWPGLEWVIVGLAGAGAEPESVPASDSASESEPAAETASASASGSESDSQPATEPASESGSAPEVRCYLIDDGQVRETELRVDET